MKKISIALLFVAAGFSWWYLRSPKPIRPGEYKDFNVLLITLDTTRADHLPMYGYAQVETPHLDRLARESFIFDDALSHVPLTLPSHASILTGLLPTAHGIRDNAGAILPVEIETLPEILHKQGYRTAAFVSSFVLDSKWQLNQGFDFYFDAFHFDPAKQLTSEDAERPAQETVLQTTRWLKNHSDHPFFAWVHFYDPHHPYVPPEPFKTKYASSLYDGEIAFMDQAIGSLLDQLSAAKVREKTIVIVTGDHGEGLGEHQEDTHAIFIYNTTQRVPLLIHLPGVKSAKRIESLVRHIDVMPTILELLGVQARTGLDGSSLVAEMNGDPKDRSGYIESMYSEFHYGWSPLKGIVANRHKYIDAPQPELYDRIRDPAEQNNLFTDEKKLSSELKRKLDLLHKSGDRYPAASMVPDDETEQALRALGYVAANSVTKNSDRDMDPKDGIHMVRNLNTATEKAQQSQYAQALQLVQQVLNEDPTIAEAHFVAGVCYLGLQRFEDAESEFLESLMLRPGHTLALYNLGYTYELQGDSQAAIETFLRVVKREPAHLHANLKLAHLYHRLNQPVLARPYFQVAIERYKQHVSAAEDHAAKSNSLAALGEAYFGIGDLNQAERHFEAAIALTPKKNNLHYNLGSIYEVQGKSEEAVNAYLKEVEAHPENYKAFNNLGLLYQRSGKFDKAASCFQRIIELMPEDRRGYLLLATLYKDMGRTQEANVILQNLR